MKVLNFSSEKEMEDKVLELATKNKNFTVIGRKSVAIL